MKSPAQQYTMPEDFESATECRRENLVRANDLRKVGTPECRALALKLDNCTRLHPCGSIACSYCGRMARVQIFRVLKRFSEGLESSWVFTTILYFNDALTDAELADWRPDKLKARLRRQLHRADINMPVLGSLELDFQSDIAKWLPHFHLLVLGGRSDVERMRGVILKKNKIPELGRPARPLFIKEIHDIDAAILYCHKFVWQDRRRFIVKPHGKPVHRTKKYRLDSARHALALQVLNRLGLPGLTFKSGVDRATHPDLSEYLSLANGKNHLKRG